MSEESCQDPSSISQFACKLYRMLQVPLVLTQEQPISPVMACLAQRIRNPRHQNPVVASAAAVLPALTLHFVREAAEHV